MPSFRPFTMSLYQSVLSPVRAENLFAKALALSSHSFSRSLPFAPLDAKCSFLTEQSMYSWYIGVDKARSFPSHPMMAPRLGSMTLLVLFGMKYLATSLSSFQKHWI